jgi:blue copper oxidase
MMKIVFTVLLALTAMGSLAQNPMIIPPAIDGGTYQLTLQTGTHEFYPGVTTNTMGINGNLLGPTLIMEAGESVDISVENQLGENSTIHWHGMHVSAENDGGPHTIINDGSIWNPQFTVLDKAATYWYHPHLHEKTNEHVVKGLAGFVIVQDSEESALDLPRTYGTDDFPVVFQTKAFDGLGQVVIDTELDTAVMANGTVNAQIDLPAQVVRLRLLNGASQRAFNVTLSNDSSFHQIASDGGLLSEPVELNELLLAPGERAEILIDLTGMDGQAFSVMSKSSNIPNNTHGAGIVTMMQQTIPGYNDNPLNGADFDLFNIDVVAATANPITLIPSTLAQVNPYLEADADTTRTITLDPAAIGPNVMIEGPFVIDGVGFDMNVINQTIKLGDTEIWEIFNQSGISHPFHIHDVQFFILDINGISPPENQQGRKDVVLVPPIGSVRFITKFEDFANADTPYMYHCHMLTHEDEGMMGQFLVVDDNTSIKENTEFANIYPNPTKGGLVRIESRISMESLTIYGMDGQLIHRERLFGKTNHEIDLAGIGKNVMVQIRTTNGSYINQMIINSE